MIKSVFTSDDILRLRYFNVGDITDNYLGWLNDRQLMRYSNNRFYTHDVVSATRFLTDFHKDNIFWAIEHVASGEMIGTMTAYVDKHHNVADLGILIGHPDVRSMGYGVKAWKLALAYCFDILNLRKVTGGTSGANKPMLKIFFASRMHLEGIQREQEIIAGQPEDLVYFGMMAGQYRHA